MSNCYRSASLAFVLGVSAIALHGEPSYATDPATQTDSSLPIRSTQAGNPRTGNDDPVSKMQGEMVSQQMSDDDSVTNFEHADTDSSGSISRDEFAALKHDAMTFTDLDTDRNSVISHMEWDNHGQNTDDDK